MKYLYMLLYEIKTIVRDAINLVMFIFPMIIIVLATIVFPRILESLDPLNASVRQMTMLMLLIVILSFGSLFIGAMAAFMLIENKDEKTLNTIAVTPVGVDGYLKFKMTYIYIMTLLSNILVLAVTKYAAHDKYLIGTISLFDNISMMDILLYSAVSALFVPLIALFQGALARNKVEGFALIKGTGIIALLPILIVLESFHGKLQYILGLIPGFWAIKGIMTKLFPLNNPADLSFHMYLLIGVVYNILILAAAYKLFLKKAEY